MSIQNYKYYLIKSLHKHIEGYHSIQFRNFWSSIKKLSKMEMIEFDFDEDNILTGYQKNHLLRRTQYKNIYNYYDRKESNIGRDFVKRHKKKFKNKEMV